MTKNEKEILQKVLNYTRIYKPLNPADIHGVAQHSHYSHYAMEYVEEILTGLLNNNKNLIDENLECLECNYNEFQEKVSIRS